MNDSMKYSFYSHEVMDSRVRAYEAGEKESETNLAYSV